MNVATEAGVIDRLYSLEGCQDPYRIYEELLEGPPMHDAGGGQWLAVHHDAVLATLRDARLGHVSEPALPDETLEQRINRTIFIKRNPPDHTYLRGLVAKAFTPKMVRQLRPATERIVSRLIDGMADRGGEADLLAEVAAPLPVTVIADMLGVPEADRADFRRWSEAMVTPQGPAGDDVREAAESAGRDFAAFLADLVTHRRRAPGEDLISALVAVSAADRRFTNDDVIATCELLLFAGHETTVNLIGNGMLALLRHPGERARLAADPTAIGPAVEELLRYDGPVHLTARAVLEPAQVAGVELEPGAMVTTLLGAANRDPRRFERPGGLDLCRSPNPHVAFGFGIHFCLGAPLARMEAQLAIPALLARFPTLALAGDDLFWRHSLMLRGLTALPVAW